VLVNCLKMTSRICLTALFLLTISATLAAKEDDTDANSLKTQESNKECQNALECPTSPHKTRKKALQCQDDRDCRKREKCHDFFKICFATQTQESRMKLTSQTKATPSCKVDEDCGQNQTCHAFFGTCVDNPRIQTTVATKPRASVEMCQESSDCPGGQYCHDFFNMCLPNLTSYFEPTSSSPRPGCRSSSDCRNGEFCHNLSSLCLPMPTPAKEVSTRKSSYSCSSHADCKMTEFCHFLIGMRRRDQTRGVQSKELKSAVGVCIARALKNVPKDPSPVSLNCNQSQDCGKGRCCLRDLGLCVGYRLPGQLCVAEEVSFAFSCPCLPGFTCISRRRPMRLKRLEKKLKLPKEAMKKLSSQFNKATTEFKVGKCQLISH